MLTVDNLNIEPNLEWYIVLSGGISVQLYKSLADAQSGSNLIASGSSGGYGDSVEVVLEAQPAAEGLPTAFKKFNDYVDWHVLVSGQAGDATVTYKVGPFTDLEDISHSIYLNQDIIPYRAASEINQHTHLDNQATISVAAVDLSVDCGQAVNVQIAREGISDTRYLKQIDFEFAQDSMLMTLTASKYELLKR